MHGAGTAFSQLPVSTKLNMSRPYWRLNGYCLYIIKSAIFNTQSQTNYDYCMQTEQMLKNSVPTNASVFIQGQFM